MVLLFAYLSLTGRQLVEQIVSPLLRNHKTLFLRPECPLPNNEDTNDDVANYDGFIIRTGHKCLPLPSGIVELF